MPTPTYDLIASQVLSSNAASISFTSIPATYRDLVLVVDCTLTSAATIFLRANSDSSTTYRSVNMRGDGSSPSTSTQSGSELFVGYLDGKSVMILQYHDYAVTNRRKSILSRSNTGGWVHAVAGRYETTTAISSTQLFPSGGASFLSGSTFHLFGIAG